uniref:Uncharacterized protein n=1 Tax=Panagrolaimus sp. JU765 TaxID=591449 RepID=A0AC34QTM0_9BILA
MDVFDIIQVILAALLVIINTVNMVLASVAVYNTNYEYDYFKIFGPFMVPNAFNGRNFHQVVLGLLIAVVATSTPITNCIKDLKTNNIRPDTCTF